MVRFILNHKISSSCSNSKTQTQQLWKTNPHVSNFLSSPLFNTISFANYFPEKGAVVLKDWPPFWNKHICLATNLSKLCWKLHIGFKLIFERIWTWIQVDSSACGQWWMSQVGNKYKSPLLSKSSDSYGNATADPVPCSTCIRYFITMSSQSMPKNRMSSCPKRAAKARLPTC